MHAYGKEMHALCCVIAFQFSALHSTADILVESKQSDANLGQSCSGSQPSDDVSISTVCCQSQQNTNDPEEPQQVAEYNSSQLSDETTITLGSHSQTTTADSQESTQKVPQRKSTVYVNKECQTTDVVFLLAEEYRELSTQASFCLDFKNNLNSIRSILQKDGFQKNCRDCSAENLYFCIHDAICTEQMSDERKNLVKVRTMVIIYIMVYS